MSLDAGTWLEWPPGRSVIVLGLLLFICVIAGCNGYDEFLVLLNVTIVGLIVLDKNTRHSDTN